MASKNISIRESVYERLAEEKREGESFSDVIDRLLRDRPLADFWGTWSEETAREHADLVRRDRDRADERVRRHFEE